MNPNDSSEINVTTLLALRQVPDALRLITERLKVKEMGPADHIRTKHEVKTFIESSSEADAESLLRRVAERREVGQKLAQKITHRHSQSL